MIDLRCSDTLWHGRYYAWLLLAGFATFSFAGCKTAQSHDENRKPHTTNPTSDSEDSDRLRACPPPTYKSKGQTPNSESRAPNPEPRTPNPDNNPLPYFRTVANNAATLDQYVVDLIRYERRGLLFKKLHGPERIRAWYRNSPRAIRLLWLDDDVKYGDAVYCEQTDPRRVRFQPRKWLPPLLPGVNKMGLQTPVTLGETLYPITEFGVAATMSRVVRDLEEAGDAVTVTRDGLQPIEPLSRQAERFTIRFSPSETKQPKRHLFIDRATNLPVAVELFNADDELYAAYYYDNLTPTISLNDADFLLECERSRPNPPKSPPLASPPPPSE